MVWGCLSLCLGIALPSARYPNKEACIMSSNFSQKDNKSGSFVAANSGTQSRAETLNDCRQAVPLPPLCYELPGYPPKARDRRTSVGLTFPSYPGTLYPEPGVGVEPGRLNRKSRASDPQKARLVREDNDKENLGR